MTGYEPRRISIIDADVAIPITTALAEIGSSERDDGGAGLAQVQASVTVAMPVEEAERCWHEFVAQQQVASAQADSEPDAGDRGTAFFTEKGNGQTDVTMQVDSTTADPSGVESYLERFKRFVEAR